MTVSDAFEASITSFLAPVAHLLEDPGVSEIMINGHREIWIERGGIIEPCDAGFPSAEALEAAITNISQYARRPVSASRPILEAHLPDGSRLEAVLPPVAKNGPAVAIRKFARSTLTARKLAESGSLSEESLRVLAAAVRRKLSVVVSGGTGSGKTSLLGVLSSFASDAERIVVIEDTHEVRLERSHVVYLEARASDRRGRGEVTIRDLLRATLRLRPDRIVVGEVRGAEALDLIQAMTSGHGGSMTTVHANSAGDAVRRIETMAMMADTGLPLQALRAQVASAVDLIVQAQRAASGRRLVTEICRVDGLERSGGYRIRPLFTRKDEGPLARERNGKEKIHAQRPRRSPGRDQGGVRRSPKRS